MAKILQLIWIWIWLFTACVSEPNKCGTAGYELASPEDKERAEQCKMELHMSLDECKASCPGYQFIKINGGSDRNYEVWEAKYGKEKDLFLYVVDGKIQMTSEHISTEPGK
jgi:hypothetical protein